MNGVELQDAFTKHMENLAAEMEAVGDCSHIRPFNYVTGEQAEVIARSLMDEHA